MTRRPLVIELKKKHLIHKKQRGDSEALKLETSRYLAMPQNSTHESYEDNQWQRADLAEPKPHHKQAQLSGSNA